MSDDDDDDGPPDPRVEELLEKYTDAIGEFNKAQIEQTTTKREDERERKETEAARVAVEQQKVEAVAVDGVDHRLPAAKARKAVPARLQGVFQHHGASRIVFERGNLHDGLPFVR